MNKFGILFASIFLVATTNAFADDAPMGPAAPVQEKPAVAVKHHHHHHCCKHCHHHCDTDHK